MKLLTSSSILLLSLAVVGCGGSSTGGDRTVFEAPQPATPTPTPTPSAEPTPQPVEIPEVITVAASDLSAKDDNNGVPVSEGGTGPLKTLQAALDRVLPGGRIRVIGGREIYTSEANSESDIQGFVLNTSGLLNNPIIIEGVADDGGNFPIINQQRTTATETSFLGLVLNCVSHVEVRHLDIRDVNDAGVSSSLSGCETKDINLHDLTISGVHGFNNTAGVRLAGVSDVRIKNNTISNIFEYESDDAVTPETLAGSGIIKNIDISGNEITKIEQGIALQTHRAGLIENVEVASNQLTELSTGVEAQVGQLGAGTFEKVYIHHNVSNDVEQFVSIDHQLANQSLNLLTVSNNTVLKTTRPALEFRGVNNASVYNNLFIDLGQEVMMHHHVPNAEVEQSISLFGYNGYWKTDDLNWVLNQGEFQRDSHGLKLTSLEDWQQAEHTLLTATPGNASWEADPRFINAEGGDFSLLADSPALNAGLNGETIGALPLWSEQL